MSLTTTQSPVERTAHSYTGSLYLLPSDDEERQRYVRSAMSASYSSLCRLLAQHQLYTRLLSGRLILPPISFSNTGEVLDIGTGAGKPSLFKKKTYTDDVTPIQAHGSAMPGHTSPKRSSSTASTSNRASSPVIPPSPPTSTFPSAPRPTSQPTGLPNLPSLINVS